MISCDTPNWAAQRIDSTCGAHSMPDILDPTSRWERELTNLRSRIGQRRRGSGDAGPDLTDAALITCDGLLRDLAGAHLECERLRGEVRAETANWEHLFDAMPGGCLITDRGGVIRIANRAAATILNTSARHLKDRPFLVFSQDRVAFSSLLQRLARGGEHVRATLVLRPRERKATAVDVIAIPLSPDQTGDCVWFISPRTDSQKSDAAAETAISASDR